MVWCRQVTRHYLNQCWPKYMSPYGVTRPQRVNSMDALFVIFIKHYGTSFVSNNFELHLLFIKIFLKCVGLSNDRTKGCGRLKSNLIRLNCNYESIYTVRYGWHYGLVVMELDWPLPSHFLDVFNDVFYRRSDNYIGAKWTEIAVVIGTIVAWMDCCE